MKRRAVGGSVGHDLFLGECLWRGWEWGVLLGLGNNKDIVWVLDSFM